MRGFPGFMNQKLSGVAASLPALPSPSLARTPAAGPSTTPPVPVLMMRPAPPAPVPPVALPLIRQMTVATVTRNLVAALAPEAPPLTPTTQGFPNFVSRNFQQVCRD